MYNYLYIDPSSSCNRLSCVVINMKQKTRDIVIDADHIFFSVCDSKLHKSELTDGVPLSGKGKVSLKPYKEHFKRIIDDYVTTAEVESICYKWIPGKVRVIISDHTNYRYDIFPNYKKDRPEKSDIKKRLKKWAMKKYQYEPNTEADEVCCYYVREEGAIGFSPDKDVFMTEGKWFNCHHMHRNWVINSKRDAEYFFKQQILAGDSVDGIPGVAGIGLASADKLMQKYGSSYEDILSIFKDPTKILAKKGKPREKSYSKKYMIKMAQLVDMTSWEPKKGIQLWEFP